MVDFTHQAPLRDLKPGELDDWIGTTLKLKGGRAASYSALLAGVSPASLSALFNVVAHMLSPFPRIVTGRRGHHDKSQGNDRFEPTRALPRTLAVH